MAKEKAYEANCVKLILLKEGTYDLKEELIIACPISIHGAGQDKTIIQGKGIQIKGPKKEKKRVNMKGLTIKGIQSMHSRSFHGHILHVHYFPFLFCSMNVRTTTN